MPPTAVPELPLEPTIPFEPAVAVWPPDPAEPAVPPEPWSWLPVLPQPKIAVTSAAVSDPVTAGRVVFFIRRCSPPVQPLWAREFGSNKCVPS
jgi:hypothetical protein